VEYFGHRVYFKVPEWFAVLGIKRDLLEQITTLDFESEPPLFVGEALRRGIVKKPVPMKILAFHQGSVSLTENLVGQLSIFPYSFPC